MNNQALMLNRLSPSVTVSLAARPWLVLASLAGDVDGKAACLKCAGCWVITVTVTVTADLFYSLPGLGCTTSELGHIFTM